MSKKRNIEEIRKEFEDRGYILLSNDYIDQHQYLEFICKKHKDEGVQRIRYDSFRYKHNGCHYCAKEKQSKRDRTPIEKIKEIISEKKKVFVDVEYVKGRCVVKYVCPVHKDVGVQCIDLNRLAKTEELCSRCRFENTKNKFFKQFAGLNKPYKILGDYIDDNTEIEVYCEDCNITFLAKPRNLLRSGNNCPECKRKANSLRGRLTHNEFVNKMKDLYPFIEVIGNYVDSITPVELYCHKHDCRFFAKPAKYLYKHGKQCCPMGYPSMISDEEFKRRLDERYNGKIICLEKYKGRFKKHKFKCLEHDYVWDTCPNVLYVGKGCPKCNISIGEIEIEDYLEKHDFDYVYQMRFDDCRDKRTLPFDFYIPSLNMCIEYDGEGHYDEHFYDGRINKDGTSLEDTKRRDEIKTKYCEDNGIKLLRIPYTQKKNIGKILDSNLIC